ncbi:unnamed protein product [Arabidopsis lyrata]|uniref:Uncharacterized protein n=1 Tax=Arabidopsis lyrata subsp. lyrata TaxID=81972 RepID=D7M5P6_ARALL|nr:hypothetical protein ARALYDRAFT_912209 [Arabidopsis lyrata subsp. lyrata]CAH8273643.1 unnamed protein product [Arabidopsis lyrata]
MASQNSKLHLVVFMIIVSLLANRAQSTRVMDDTFPECEFKGPCRMKNDCIATCGGEPSRALCIPNPSVDTLQCCCLSN